MLTYWKFKQIYKHTPYWKYVWNSFKNWFRGVINIPRATYLCIKYPFLYPRNRFNDLHYNNWKIQNFLNEIVKKYQISKFGGDYKDCKFSNLQIESFKDRWYYFKQVSPTMVSGWTNWWAKPLCTIVQFYHNCILQIFHCLPIYTEWDCMEKGWKKAFGKQYLKDLKEAAIKDGYLKSLRITQLKEKWGCYDEITEVLTKNGWKLFSNVTYEDEIATLNPNTQYLEYHKPTDLIAYKYTGPMYRLENRGVSLNVTPNHNLYVSKGSYFYAKKGNLKVTYPFELCTPDKYFGKDKRFLKGCKWEGIQPEKYFQIPDYVYTQEYQDKRWEKTITRTYVKKGPKIEIKAFLRFLGFYIAEGSTSIKEGKNGAYISVAFNPADETELVKTLIKDIGFNCKIYKGENSARFSSTSLGHWLREHCGHRAPNKKVPDFIKQLPPEYIKIFLEYLYIGDGYKDKTSWKLTTTSKQLRDDVCELILKCGHAFRFYTFQPRPSFNSVTGQMINSKLEHYDINWMKNIELEIDGSKAKKSKSFVETWENYDNMVYCVTVPNHIIYIRRNGKGVWCGNSCQLYLNSYGENVLKVIQKYEELSWNTCVKCGKPATHTSTGWICPYCEDCVNKSEYPKRFIKRGTEEEKTLILY